jgi:hypothetical protein
MKSPGSVRQGEQRPKWHKLPPGRTTSAGTEAVELAASAGLVLDEWQAWWLDHALAERADGDWCAKENVLITGRQSGKNGALAALELFYLFMLGDPLVIHSAHELPTAINHFHFLLSIIDATPDLSRQCKRPTFTNGEQAINLHSGAVLKFRARGKNSGRGLTAARLVFDEAFKIPAEAMGALLPTLRAMRNTQVTYASSAPKADSTVLHSLIRRGRADDPDDRLFYAEWGNPPGTAMDDVDAWYAANPALGIIRNNGTGITEEALHDEYRSLVAGGDPELIAEFSREAVGIGEEPIETVKPVKLPADKWAATEGPPPPIAPGQVTVAYDVDLNSASASIAIGAGSINAPYVEVVDFAEGAGWVPARLVEIVQRWKPVAVGCNGAGPAGSMVGPVLAAFKDAGLDIELTQMSAVEYKQACGGFYGDVVEGRLVHPPGQGPLDAAAADAGERPLGDAWAWDRRSASVPISPLVAPTIARALLPIEERADPMLMLL